MDGEIVERAVAGRCFVLPIVERVGVGHEILVHFDAQVIHGANDILFEEPGNVADRRILDVIVTEHANLARAPSGITHPQRVGERRRHRFLAPDVFASLEGGDGHLSMECIRCGDRDHVDRIVGNEFTPVTAGSRKAELGSASSRQFGRDIGKMGEAWRWPFAEDGLYRDPSEGMALAHESRANQADAQCSHARHSGLMLHCLSQ